MGLPSYVRPMTVVNEDESHESLHPVCEVMLEWASWVHNVWIKQPDSKWLAAGAT